MCHPLRIASGKRGCLEVSVRQRDNTFLYGTNMFIENGTTAIIVFMRASLNETAIYPFCSHVHEWQFFDKKL